MGAKGSFGKLHKQLKNTRRARFCLTLLHFNIDVEKPYLSEQSSITAVEYMFKVVNKTTNSDAYSELSKTPKTELFL